MMVMIVIGFMIEALTMVILEMELNKGGWWWLCDGSRALW
jgi:hypothetical protein